MKLPLILVAALAASPALAQDNSIYVGGGGDSAFSLGMVHQLPNRAVIGFDIGSEGTMHDSTWGADRERAATSFNLLVGANVYDSGKTKIDAALLVGARETYADCPDSYLGYQCYADEEPDTDYAANVGVVATVSHGKFLTGLRVTGESAQALIGIRF